MSHCFIVIFCNCNNSTVTPGVFSSFSLPYRKVINLLPVFSINHLQEEIRVDVKCFSAFLLVGIHQGHACWTQVSALECIWLLECKLSPTPTQHLCHHKRCQFWWVVSYGNGTIYLGWWGVHTMFCWNTCACLLTTTQNFHILPVPFPTPPTLKVHSQGHPCVLIDDVGDTDSRDDLQQVGGNSSIKSCHALPGHNVVNQGQHGGFGGSFLWNWEIHFSLRCI